MLKTVVNHRNLYKEQFILEGKNKDNLRDRVWTELGNRGWKAARGRWRKTLRKEQET